MKKGLLALSILSILTISSFANAGYLSLEPSNWKYSSWCTVWIDIMMDPKWEQISATDIIVESSMQFIKFEPTKLFPYFFPAKTIDNLVHIVWFTSWPSQRVNQAWVIWKIYFKPSSKTDSDWSIKFYIKKQWETTDTNLSIWWWIDVLNKAQNWFYTFDGTNCDYPDENIAQDSQEINFDKELEKTMGQIEKDHRAALLEQSREDNKYYIISLFIIVVILAAYTRKSKWRWKKK